MPGYTLRQVRGYLDSIARQERADKLDRLVIARAAWADKDGFKEIWKAFS